MHCNWNSNLICPVAFLDFFCMHLYEGQHCQGGWNWIRNWSASTVVPSGSFYLLKVKDVFVFSNKEIFWFGSAAVTKRYLACIKWWMVQKWLQGRLVSHRASLSAQVKDCKVRALTCTGCLMCQGAFRTTAVLLSFAWHFCLIYVCCLELGRACCKLSGLVGWIHFMI